jgi:hypothetical protein
MQDKSSTKLSGEVEVDESFIGGKSRNRHRHKRIGHGDTGEKEIAFGMVERRGNVRVIHTRGRGKPELQRHIRADVTADSALFSDALKSWDKLTGKGL